MRLIRLLFIAAIGGFLTLLGVAIYVLNQQPKLFAWHTQYLDKEFVENGSVKTFQEYLALEDQLFSQLHSKIYARISKADQHAYNRYSSGSKSDPAQVSPNWNRTYELTQDNPTAIALMLHGLSDSPYSLRSLGQFLHQQNMHVVGLRIPGHGTAPSGLLRTTWQDMAAAVRLAMAHVAEKAGDKPIFLVGYSNGAALALNYTLASVNDAALRRPDKLVLFSPEIEISPVAILAKWQARIGQLLGLHNLAWSSVLPEFDPYKYGSFAVNAGDLAYQMTGENQRLISELERSGKLRSIPPILAFQSVVDATISAKAVVTKLFDRLPAGDHELVLFDVNRRFSEDELFKKPPDISTMFSKNTRLYTVHLVTNTEPGNRTVELRTRVSGESQIKKRPLQLEWPEKVYSLAHIALPFPPDDPVYGGSDRGTNMVQLGSLALYGEERVLAIPTSVLMRQRWNPFYRFVLDHVSHFVSKAVKVGP
jgi:alpha-beta hydrolase superfamily lysophospholipase